VVDVWDALRSDRPYRSAWREKEVRAYILARAGIDFDPDVVEAFLGMLRDEPLDRAQAASARVTFRDISAGAYPIN
jgi:HD-GYP domain-containing protein (c-di-GMP phosphodiesterase class II)